jgi:hypothetical protein
MKRLRGLIGGAVMMAMACSSSGGKSDDAGGRSDDAGGRSDDAGVFIDPNAYSQAPDPAAMVAEELPGGGVSVYPVNQVLILTVPGTSRQQIETSATAIHAAVVGQIPDIDLYQLSLATTTTAELEAALTAVRAWPFVRFAMRNVRPQAFEAKCPAVCDLAKLESTFRCAADDSEYLTTLTILDALRPKLTLSKVRIGIVDTGIAESSPDFGNVRIVNVDNPGRPIPKVKIHTPGGDIPDNSHGTAVAGVMVAKDGNGGVNGMASRMLKDQLELYWGGGTGPKTAPGITYEGDVAASLVSLQRVADNGAKVVNYSMGFGKSGKDVLGVRMAYQELFARYAKKTLFVIAAPNLEPGEEPYDVATTTAAPAGIDAENVLTVGGISACEPNKMSALSTRGGLLEILAAAYLVPSVPPTVAAGGDSFIPKDGNSFAAPIVASLATVLAAIKPALTPAELKRRILSGAMPSSAQVNGRRVAFSVPILELIRETTTDASVKHMLSPSDDPNYNGTGLIIARACAGLHLEISGWGAWDVSNQKDDSMQGFINTMGFGFFLAPPSGIQTSLACQQCTFSLGEFPFVEELTPNAAGLSFTLDPADPIKGMGTANSGILTVKSCRIDQRFELNNQPFLVNVEGKIEGTISIGRLDQPPPQTQSMDGVFSMPFNTGGLGLSNDLLDTLEKECEGGNQRL